MPALMLTKRKRGSFVGGHTTDKLQMEQFKMISGRFLWVGQQLNVISNQYLSYFYIQLKYTMYVYILLWNIQAAIVV